MLTTFYPPYSFGGDAIFVRDLATALAARGHEVHVIHCRDAYRALTRTEPPAPPREPTGVTVHALESGVGALSPLATQQTGRPFFKARKIEAVLARGFDVIHYHNVSLLGGPALLALGRAALKLYTLHEYWLVCPTHLLYRFGRAPCTTRHCTLCTLSYGRPPQLWRATGLLADSIRHVDAFLSPSRFGMASHRRFGLDAPIVHLPSFVPDDEGAAPASDTRHGDAPYFLYVGRLERPKGPHELIAHFRRRGRARLLVAGAGSEEAALRRLAGNDDRIRLLGRVDRAALRGLYRGAVAVVVPSLNVEILPLVILEAARESTPVVARNCGALPEVIAESGGGLLYESDDQHDAALAALLADPARRAELGRNARRTYEREWTPDVHVGRYLALIAERMGGRLPAAVSS
jgi:glycosyltransferase involved in cell wall biosynthesis